MFRCIVQIRAVAFSDSADAPDGAAEIAYLSPAELLSDTGPPNAFPPISQQSINEQSYDEEVCLAKPPQHPKSIAMSSTAASVKHQTSAPATTLINKYVGIHLPDQISSSVASCLIRACQKSPQPRLLQI